MDHDLLERMLLGKSAELAYLPIWFLQSITNNISEDRKIGSGGFADVYKGLLRNGTVVTVKKLKQSEMVELDEKKFQQEISSLMKLKHENIVRILGYCADTQSKLLEYDNKYVMVEERQRFLCFEFVPEGSLDNHISDASRGLDWRTRYHIIKGICMGLHYLHRNKIVHLDLKPANVLLHHYNVPKIADFGLARCFDEEQTHIFTSNKPGTLGYMAPEYIDTEVITLNSDIFSLGKIITEILTGQKKEDLLVENVLESWSTRFQTSQGGTWLQHVRVCAEIGLECTSFDPKKRPTTQHIIESLEELECTYGSIETDISATHPFKDGLIKDSSSVTSNVSSPSMANTQVVLSPQSQGTEYNRILYMYQIIHGPNHNQINIADPQQPRMFGYTNVHDYPIHDGLGPSANIVAQAQGLHTETSMNYNNWFHWSSIVFSDERFLGSSLIAIGNLTHEGEWAIVGGTGVFTFAHGTIALRRVQNIGSSNIKEIRINAFCCISQTVPNQTKPFSHWLMMNDSNNADSNVDGPTMANQQSGSVTPQSQGTNYNLKLYMHQTIDGPNHNQVNIADPITQGSLRCLATQMFMTTQFMIVLTPEQRLLHKYKACMLKLA